MKNPIQAMFEAGIVERTDFPPESRYHGIPTTQVTGPDGQPVSCLKCRLAPPPEEFALRHLRETKQGERLDRIAAAETGDPEMFWLLMDANGALWAKDLEAPETTIRITWPRGVPAPPEE
ncbi:hypothetical protein [Rhodovulum sp.]|uniref:hypothetical protein n=1 Tax=Rhodovulum sp. TaxID=34009 RepID=UPI00257C7E96|nr:hypothetical protein [Rhodovulum sp.]